MEERNWCDLMVILRRIDHKDTDSIDKAAADGFNFIGTLHSYELNIPNLCGEIHVRRGSNEHLNGAIRIGLSELRHSRLYTDPKIPFEVAQKIYEDRIRIAFREVPVFVAVHESVGVVGFCSLRDGEITLIAISKYYQRRGIATRLIQGCIDECRSAGLKKLKIATQGSNCPARNLYEKLGFKVTQIEKEFHKHENTVDR